MIYPIQVTEYKDWGTQKDWQEFKDSFKILLLDTTKIQLNVEVVEQVNLLFETNKYLILLFIEHDNLLLLSQKKLLQDIKYHQLIQIPHYGQTLIISNINQLLEITKTL